MNGMNYLLSRHGPMRMDILTKDGELRIVPIIKERYSNSLQINRFFRTGAIGNAITVNDAVYVMGLNSPWQTTREIHKFQNNQWILDVGRLQDDQYNRVSIQIGNEFFIYGRNGG